MTGIDFERFRHHMRPHTEAEKQGLVQSLEQEGCRDALIVGVINGHRYLVDGFSRKTYCDDRGIKYDFREKEFKDEPEILAWMEKNARARRNQTRTERNYYIGCRYLREKQPHGGQVPGNGKRDGKKVAIDSTAERIASENRCSHQHVKNCARLAQHIAELEGAGLHFFKWPILTERLKLGIGLICDLIEVGPGGCIRQIQDLLNANETVTGKMVRDALGWGEKEPEPIQPLESLVAKKIFEASDLARQAKSVEEMEAILAHIESTYQMLKLQLGNMKSHQK